jgi:hypothetical protein
MFTTALLILVGTAISVYTTLEFVRPVRYTSPY